MEGCSASLLQRNPPGNCRPPRALTSVVPVLGQEAAGGGYRGHGSDETRTPPLSGRSLRGKQRVSMRSPRPAEKSGPGPPTPPQPLPGPGGSPASPRESRRSEGQPGPRFSSPASTSGPPGRPYMGRGGGRPAPGAVWRDGREPASVMLPHSRGPPASRPGHLGTSSRLPSLSTFLECIKWGLRAADLINDSHPCGEGLKGDEIDRYLFQ